ncbi:P-loop containing nucleoside triphosphate hydrolase protein [Macrolepiota fuliginosa MF-IS2]|uniref:P-loop containing nucleoside triphosphate hydrolase protein n=1 Tax=Macrolepiota fuliginosa MF-IS2 TaxID=1400762 RepID=A0A9P6BYZ9_9AGAR|nr:P-loop containing nucleoside triphosphate hydrolase protein [Macrolepiota fuliginosa MF-IS2]
MEPTLELYTHSGRALLTALLGALSTLSFLRPAEPGQFTKRAILSGRLDLAEVEGLVNVIDAEVEGQRKIAGRGARGEIRKVLDDLRNRIIHCLAQVKALIGFGEGEDLEEGVYEQDNHRGEIIRSGIKLAIFGPPNARKSSLSNYLTQCEAAIVTAIPCTMRDVLQLTLNIGGMPAVVVDTPGLRTTEDVVETIGIGKGVNAVRETDIVLYILSLPDMLASPTKSETDNKQVIQLPETIRELAATRRRTLS